MLENLFKKFWLLILVIFTVAIYAKVANFEFLSFDDGLYVTNNFWVINFTWESVFYFFTNNIFGHYFPLTMLTYGLQSKVFGLSPGAFHLFNLLVHLGNIWLVAIFLKKFNFNFWLVVFVTTVFALHPIQVESVAWVGTRAGLLSTFFSFGALIFYINYINKQQTKFLIFCSLLFVLAVFSKSQAILLSPLFFVFDYYFKRKLEVKLFLEKIPFFIISFVFGVISIIAARELGTVSTKGLAAGETLPGYFRILEILYSASYYFNAILFPYDYTAMHYNPKPETGFFPPRFYWGFLIPTVLVGLSFLMKIKPRLIIFSLGFYFITLLSVINIIPLGGTIVSERYGYFASIPVLIFMGSLIQKTYNSFIKNELGNWILLAFISIVLTVVSFNRLEVWRNTFNLFQDIYQKAPNIAHAQNGFANELARKKEYQKSIELQSKAVESTPNAKHYGDRAGVYYMMDSLNLALKDYTQAINFNATSSEYYRKRAFVKQKLGDLQGTLKDVNLAVEIDREDFVARQLRAETKLYLGDFGGACEDWKYLQNKGVKTFDEKIKKYCLEINKEEERAKTIFYPDGKKKIEIQIDSTENEKTQWLISYDPNGNMTEKGEIKNGKYNGRVFWYYSTGELLREGFFTDILPYGEWKEYYKNGKTKAKFSHKNGVKHGEYFYYYSNGNIWTQKEYKNGLLWEIVNLLDKNGNPLPSGTFNAGEGVLFVYDSLSAINQKVTYKNGRAISYENINN